MMPSRHQQCRNWLLLLSIAPFLFCWDILAGVEASFVIQTRQSTAPSLLCDERRNQFVSHAYQRSAATPTSSYTLLQMNSRRENEIRQKIGQLKRQGKIANTSPSSTVREDGTQKPPPVADQYGDRVKQKLGARKARLLGANIGKDVEEEDPMVAELDADEYDEAEVEPASSGRTAQLGSLPREAEESDVSGSKYKKPSEKKEYKNFDASLFDDDDDDDDDDDELSEKELVELVAKKLAEKRYKEKQEEEAQAEAKLSQRLEDLKKEQEQLKKEEQAMMAEAASSGKTTSGIGGSWTKKNETLGADYKPSSSGTWGVFERPKDISSAFGGGKRVGAGYTQDSLTKKKFEESTRDRLKEYREKVGIDVQSEKDHAAEIEEALEIGNRAMQRGIYGTAVSALEKVTKWCSTNSPVGGKVFLELAMAYEAVGRTQEAIMVYNTLSTSRMEDIKYNAKRLLYGIEAMRFMQEEARNKDFSRKKIKNTFIETTGLANIAQNFDDVYNTAYVDLDKGIYRSLTENVVRSNREARQVLLQARGAGEVQRLRVVQALRSISRHFDDALEEEIKNNMPAPEPVAIMNGKPILVEPARQKKDELQNMMGGMDEFLLASADQMLINLNGVWELQLLADKRGDGVKYFNTSLSWQSFDTGSMSFTSSGSAGFLTVDQSGGIEFEEKRRILKRTDLSVSGSGGIFSGFLNKGSGGVAGAISTPHQIVSVDSILLITRMAPTEKIKSYADSTKEYFAVWRKAEPGSLAASAASS